MNYFLRPCEVEEKAVRAPLGLWGGVMAAVFIVGLSGGVCAQGTQITDVMADAGMLLLHSHTQGYMGIFVGDLDQERAQALHLKDTQGAEITVLDHDAPAAKVGLKLHDVVLAMNGVAIEDADTLRRMLRDLRVGRKVQLTISREGAQQTVTVQMADRYKMQEEARQQLNSVGSAGVAGQGFLTGTGDVPASSGFHLWSLGSSLHVGALVEPLAPQTAELLGVTGGVMIKSVARKSAADAAGLKPHDVIVGIGGEPVVTSSDFERLLRTSEGKPVQVEILRDRVKQLVLLQVDGKRHKS